METVIFPETTLQIPDGRDLALGLTDSGYCQRSKRLVSYCIKPHPVINPAEYNAGSIMANINDTVEEHVCLFLRRNRGCAIKIQNSLTSIPSDEIRCLPFHFPQLILYH